jgi:hypothetical protein
MKQKSKRESKESQLPSKSEGCNERTRFQGQLRFPGKLGMCPSLAEPDLGGFPKRSVSNHEQPTFAKQIGFCNFVFLLQLHVLKLSNSNKVVS